MSERASRNYRLACILAAGRGYRMGLDRPKGFLELGGSPIVEQSLRQLLSSGIERVVLVTGYRSEFYENLAQKFGDVVRLAHNPEFHSSGSLYSLWLARELLREPYLLLESDLIYEKRALEICQADPREDLVLVSGFTQAGDEVYVGAPECRLRHLSKNPEQIETQILGEFVGICKISSPLHHELMRVMERSLPENLRQDYETDGLVEAARHRELPCRLIEDLIWAEIDDAAHLQRAQTLVYPRLQELRRKSAL